MCPAARRRNLTIGVHGSNHEPCTPAIASHDRAEHGAFGPRSESRDRQRQTAHWWVCRDVSWDHLIPNISRCESVAWTPRIRAFHVHCLDTLFHLEQIAISARL